MFIEDGVIQDYRDPKEIIESNPYYLEEIDFKEKLDFKVTFDGEISSTKHHNRLIVTCPNKEDLVNKIKLFKEENSAEISSTRHCENNLQSTLVGFNKLSLTDKQADKKGKGNKKRRK